MLDFRPRVVRNADNQKYIRQTLSVKQSIVRVGTADSIILDAEALCTKNIDC